MRTLVLNAGYEPLAVVSFRRALLLVLHEKAVVVEARGEPVCGVCEVWDRPSVILLNRYVRIPQQGAIPVSRRGVLRRDEYRCAYCRRPAATIDHVVPRSRGGADSWENLVACCLSCNNRKGDRTPVEMGWTLRREPRRPAGPGWVFRGIERAQSDWAEYLVA